LVKTHHHSSVSFFLFFISWLFTKWDLDKDGSLSVDDVWSSIQQSSSQSQSSQNSASLPKEAIEMLSFEKRNRPFHFFFNLSK